jgi:hypothetical protein
VIYIFIKDDDDNIIINIIIIIINMGVWLSPLALKTQMGLLYLPLMIKAMTDE